MSVTFNNARHTSIRLKNAAHSLYAFGNLFRRFFRESEPQSIRPAFINEERLTGHVSNAVFYGFG